MSGREDRFHDGDKPADYRSTGERDRDRILYSTALRRLAGVTQVVAADEGHIFHNRLTHTLEVAQIARRLAQKLIKEHEADAITAIGGIDPDVVESAALAHDLGHPPFGHMAEEELQRLAIREGLDAGFEGNPQSYRIVTKLSLRKEAFPGLNLSRATLNAVSKYPWYREVEGERHRKWGAYPSESTEFSWARAACSPPDVRTVEAEIMDWADDIAYSVHDVEDFYRGGLVPLDRLATDEREVRRFLEGVFARWKREGKRIPFPENEIAEAFERFVRILPVREPYDGGLRQRAALRSVTSVMIGRYVDVLKLKIPYPGTGSRVDIMPTMLREIWILKQLTWHYVIKNPALATQQHGQRQVIRGLFDAYFGAAKSDPSLFPKNARERLDQAEIDAGNIEERDRARVRAVIDFIAGLTEDAALNLYHRLTGISRGRLTDLFAR